MDYSFYGGVLRQPGEKAYHLCTAPSRGQPQEPVWDFGRRDDPSATLDVKRRLITAGNPRSLYEAAPFLRDIGKGQTTLISHIVRTALNGTNTGAFLKSQFQPRGTCVSRGAKRIVDICQALAKYFGATTEAFKYASHAYIYGCCRTYGNALGGDPNDASNDGAVGAWAAWAVGNDGLLHNDEDGDDDNDDKLACEWGARGVPDDVKNKGKQHLIRKVVPIRTYEEARDWIASGIGGVTVASGVGYEGQRDSNGVIRRRGRWSHQMCYTDQREDGTMSALLQNQSWGPDQPGGPLGSVEIPSYSWWTTKDDVEVQLAEHDAFGFAWVDPWLSQDLSWRP